MFDEHISCDNASSDENNSNDIGDNIVDEILKPEIVSAVACDNENISCDNASSNENNSNGIGYNNVDEILNFSDSSSGNDNEFPDEER